LNEKIKIISTVKKTELDLMKRQVFEKSQRVFDLDNQVKNLIEKEVF